MHSLVHCSKFTESEHIQKLLPPQEKQRYQYTSVVNVFFLFLYMQIYLSNANLAELLKLLRPVAAHWEHIAPLLKPPLPDGAIDAIKYENSGKPDSTRHCLREMLSKWLKRIKPCQPSWQTLRAAVDGAGIDGGDGIVKQIDDVIVQKVHQ